MLTYEQLRTRSTEFLALTGLTDKEFQTVLPAFQAAYAERYPPGRTLAGRKRRRAVGGGRKSNLATIEDKLLFVLVYQKAYPLQAVQGQLFEMSQSSANEWIHRLLPILLVALDRLGVLPERDGDQVPAHVKRQKVSQNLILDGTERRRQRPKNREKQAQHYTGRKKAHTDKNVVLVERSTRQVAFLSATYPGAVHDKTVAEQETICYPRGTRLEKDLGFAGYQPAGCELREPKKNRESVTCRPARSGIIVPWHGRGSGLNTRSLA